MKRNVTIFFQIVVVLISIGALVFMLWEPHAEGRNVDATPFEIYFKDPFLVCAYLASLPFFVVLYQIFKILGYLRQNKFSSLETIKALHTIKYCAVILIGFVVLAELYFFILQSNKGEDIAGAVAIGVLIAFVCLLTIGITVMLEKRLQNKQPSF